MKVVVTGGAGKAGRWVVRELLDDRSGGTAHRVTVFDRVQGAAPGVHYLAGDVLDLGQVFGALAGADAVIHLAAVPWLGLTTPEATFRANVIGTYNVHEAAYRLGVRRVVTCGSQAIMGWDFMEREFLPEYLPIDEGHPVKPQDAYGLSKEAAEMIARAFARKGLETVVLRPNSIVTPGEAEEFRRQGGRKPERFLLHSYVDVRDLAVAFRLAIERPVEPGTVLFVVADDPHVAEPLCDVLPRFMPAIKEMAGHLTGSRPAISNPRAKAVLGWRPVHSWRSPE